MGLTYTPWRGALDDADDNDAASGKSGLSSAWSLMVHVTVRGGNSVGGNPGANQRELRQGLLYVVCFQVPAH